MVIHQPTSSTISPVMSFADLFGIYADAPISLDEGNLADVLIP